MPGQFFIGIFIVVYFLYSFVAFRNRFEENWRTVQIGDSKTRAIEVLGSNHKEQHHIDGQIVEIQQSDQAGSEIVQFLVWEIGVNNYYVLGISGRDRVAIKARTEVSRLGAGSSTNSTLSIKADQKNERSLKFN